MISVIVPVYNVEKYLDRCLKSILEQSNNDEFEIIVVNDGSTDKSLEICEKYKKMDSRIKIISKRNGGLSSARNVGIERAKGDYVMFVDPDDYIASGTIRLFHDRLAKNDKEEIDIVVSDAVEKRGERIIYHRHNALKNGHIYTSKDYLIHSVNNNELYAPVCFNLYRLQFLKNNKLFFKEGILHEDMEYLPRAFLSARNMMYVKKDFYHYVVRDNSIMTGNNYLKKMSDLLLIYGDWLKRFKKIKNKELRKKMMAVLAKYYKASCRQNHFVKKIYPEGMSAKFLLCNCLDFIEILKTIYFLALRKMYVGGDVR